MNPYPRTWVEIDLAAIEHNLHLVRSRLIRPETKIALVAKADAYGHGLVPVSRFALGHGADWVAVATVQEGIALRDAGIDAPIIVISPILPIEAEQAVFYRLRVVVERFEIAEAMAEAARQQNTQAVLHLEVDTGLARFGILPAEAAELAVRIAAITTVQLEGICTHFSNSGRDAATTRVQLELFQRIVAECRAAGIRFEIVHASNSAGATMYQDAQFDLVRVGLAAYGMDPYGMFGGEAQAALCWKARVMALRTLPPGSPVSYSSTYHTRGTETIATLGVGYGDGYPRALSNRGFVMMHGQRAPVVGMVCMDQVLVETSQIPGVQLGDEAILAGGPVDMSVLAEIMETTTHEITTRIMSRVPRRYLYPR
ncbi:MAG TPA: alanine racemase [Fimbriimonadaceae bacterium]|nr:alanine racemase [Fimbriimonadaceae bacterium]HRJ32676.1 alanine racemase [Fimbriimonadaceae bacterium]